MDRGFALTSSRENWAIQISVERCRRAAAGIRTDRGRRFSVWFEVEIGNAHSAHTGR